MNQLVGVSLFPHVSILCRRSNLLSIEMSGNSSRSSSFVYRRGCNWSEGCHNFKRMRSKDYRKIQEWYRWNSVRCQWALQQRWISFVECSTCDCASSCVLGWTNAKTWTSAEPTSMRHCNQSACGEYESYHKISKTLTSLNERWSAFGYHSVHLEMKQLSLLCLSVIESMDINIYRKLSKLGILTAMIFSPWMMRIICLDFWTMWTMTR